VGTGSIGERHVRCFRQTGRADVGVVEPIAARRDKVAATYALDCAYRALDQALHDRHDVAVIATPAPLHIPMARKLAAQAIHLLIEKPLSTSRDGVAALRAEVEMRKLVVGVGYSWRAHPVVAALRDAVVSGHFGAPLQIIVVSGQYFPHYRPAYRETFYRDRAQGGGAVQDAITHMLNMGEWMVGPITRLIADAGHLALEGVEVEDTVHVMARHGKVMGCYTLNQHQAPNEARCTVVCQRGTLRADADRHRIEWMTEPESVWEATELPNLGRDGPYIRQANVLLDAVEGKGHPLCSLDEGIQTLKVNLATLASIDRTGRWETIE